MSYTKDFVPDVLEDLPAYLEGLEDKLDEQFNAAPVQYMEPVIKYPGLVVYADGTDWNPGSGEGLYRYNLALAWVYIG